MPSERKILLTTYYDNHRQNLNLRILEIAFIYLFLSISWNALFLFFHFAFSRANIYYLIASIIVLIIIFGMNKLFKIQPAIMQHIVLLFVVFVICCMYFGSGYREAWAYFLLLPILAALYGNLVILFVYSIIGLVIMVAIWNTHPLIVGIYDSIDISNRILLYLISGTFSYLLPKQLKQMYNNQVNIILNSVDTTVEQVVKTFIISIEAKDTYTFGHSERVSKYAVELAAKLSEFNDPKRLKALRLSGLLHDIGKINIPEAVLTKTTKLTKDEFELIKTHTVLGGRMVERISGLGSLKPGVLYHHERWDGGGYPTGISAEEIPLEARILCVADAFDAITSSRSYRPASTVNEAIALLKAEQGKQFDPRLISILDEVLVSWMKIYKESNDGSEELETLFNLL